MKNLKRYSRMLVTVMVIVMAGYAGMSTADAGWGQSTWSAGPCRAYDLNGKEVGNSDMGCCVSETESHGYMMMSCSGNCVFTTNNNSYSLECVN